MDRLSACYLSEPEPEPKRSPLFIDDAGRERIAKSFQAALEETADVIEAFRLNYLAQPDD